MPERRIRKPLGKKANTPSILKRQSIWTQMIPVWVSRKTAGGLIATFTVPFWVFMTIGVFILLNLLAWGALGLVFAVKVALGLVT